MQYCDVLALVFHPLILFLYLVVNYPHFSNNGGSTSSSTFVVTGHVEEIKELKSQVTSLKKDLVKSNEGKSKLDATLSERQSFNDKSVLGFNFN
jgi:hypothetical protein